MTSVVISRIATGGATACKPLSHTFIYVFVCVTRLPANAPGCLVALHFPRCCPGISRTSCTTATVSIKAHPASIPLINTSNHQQRVYVCRPTWAIRALVNTGTDHTTTTRKYFVGVIHILLPSLLFLAGPDWCKPWSGPFLPASDSTMAFRFLPPQ